MTTKTQTAAPLAAWLLAGGFRAEDAFDLPSYRKGSIRVTIEDERDGRAHAHLYAFETRRPKSDILDWDTRFSGAPVAAITAAITYAQDMARAALLPQD